MAHPRPHTSWGIFLPFSFVLWRAVWRGPLGFHVDRECSDFERRTVRHPNLSKDEWRLFFNMESNNAQTRIKSI
ncbi:hypothetical protein ACVWYU_004589 [Pseudomonas sp. TE12234]